MELFKQIQYKPMPISLQVTVLWAMQNGYMDAVPVDRIKEFQLKLQEFVSTRKEALLKEINAKKQVDKDLEAGLKATLEEFKSVFR